MSLIVTYDIEDKTRGPVPGRGDSTRTQARGVDFDESCRSRVRAKSAVLAEDLAQNGHDVQLLDSNAGSRRDTSRRSKASATLMADACEVSSLKAANFAEMDVVVATTGDDKDNLVISQLAKQEFAGSRVLAKGEPPEEPLALQRDVGCRRSCLHAATSRRNWSKRRCRSACSSGFLQLDGGRHPPHGSNPGPPTRR